jgi:flagellar biosynthesis chaperone FliJ
MDGAMSDVIDLRFLSGQVASLDREMRLVRLQVDQMAGSLNQLSSRVASIEQNFQQTFHGLIGEIARGFGQTHQQIARQESRISTLDAGLTTLRIAMDENHVELMAAIRETKT